MPVIVTPNKYDVWLDPDVNDFNTIRDTLKPYDGNLMRRYPVSRKLNNSNNEDAESTAPITLDTPPNAALLASTAFEQTRGDSRTPPHRHRRLEQPWAEDAAANGRPRRA